MNKTVGDGYKGNLSVNVDNDILNKLKSYSEKQNTSLDTLVNQILSDYITWSISAAKAGWVPVQKALLIALADTVDKKKLSDIASKMAKNATKDSLVPSFLPSSLVPSSLPSVNTKELITFLRNRAKVAGFSYEEKEEGGHIKFIMQHDMGMKWSLIFKSFYQSVFDDLNCPVSVYVAENKLGFEVKS
ncbi:MAG: hypothetical protein ACE5KA_07680 [Nitrososphaerales archaeon]